MRDLVEQKLLPLQAMATLDVVGEGNGTPSLSIGEIERLLAATADVVAALGESVSEAA